MRDKTFDYSNFNTSVEIDDSDVLGKITKLAEEMTNKDKEIAKLELEIKKAKEQRREIAEQKLPELMEQVGLTEVRTRTGLPVKLSEKLFTSIAGAKKPAAIAWLDENGHGGIVKRNVVIAFNKCDQDKVAALLRLIGKNWPNHKTELDVHSSSVKSLVARLLEEGVDVPQDTFGIHRVNVAEIKSK